MTIDQQLAAAEARLTELQHAFVDAAFDSAERHRLAEQIRQKRDEITDLYDRLPV
ncbi:hypothetical protein [Kitasatospora cathayae]|uniref:Uncharacterized protein n=1 Tax=Kitasatospora cathayae TaxID=3004092 RepID=A0ABY7QA33_9ACTN|nr:hypothetical protein [Kitasatospora sp. HUAS 3-15]WBP89521.1 hypothetical protein O1G21_29220 [Kitasatospora sp. HUAS 3-15]